MSHWKQLLSAHVKIVSLKAVAFRRRKSLMVESKLRKEVHLQIFQGRFFEQLFYSEQGTVQRNRRLHRKSAWGSNCCSNGMIDLRCWEHYSLTVISAYRAVFSGSILQRKAASATSKVHVHLICFSSLCYFRFPFCFMKCQSVWTKEQMAEVRT